MKYRHGLHSDAISKVDWDIIPAPPKKKLEKVSQKL